MPLLELIKTKPLLCSLAGVGTVAAPAAAICCATIGTSPVPFGTLSNKSKSSVLEKPYSSCFNGFFPGVKIGGRRGDVGHNGNISDETVDDGKQIGCALMQLDYKSSSKFAFSAEITAKNGTHGWAIKIYLKPENTSETEDSNETYRFTYNIVFLTRDSSTKTWSVEGGIYLEPSSPGTPSSNISFPNQPILANNQRDSSIEAVTSKSWFATWEESSGSGAKSIFADIKVEYDSYNKLYLGDSSFATNPPSCPQPSTEDCECAWHATYVDSKMKYEEHKWDDQTGHLRDVCSRYKQQLKDRKGTWTWQESPETFCRQLKSESDKIPIDDDKKRKLLNFCRSYKTESH